MHLPHSSTHLMRLHKPLSISDKNLQQMMVGLGGFITLLSPPSRWFWMLEYSNICLLPFLSRSICSQRWLLFTRRKKLQKPSHALPETFRRETECQSKPPLRSKQSVQEKRCADIVIDIWAVASAERQHGHGGTKLSVHWSPVLNLHSLRRKKEKTTL